MKVPFLFVTSKTPLGNPLSLNVLLFGDLSSDAISSVDGSYLSHYYCKSYVSVALIVLCLLFLIISLFLPLPFHLILSHYPIPVFQSPPFPLLH